MGHRPPPGATSEAPQEAMLRQRSSSQSRPMKCAQAVGPGCKVKDCLLCCKTQKPASLLWTSPWAQVPGSKPGSENLASFWPRKHPICDLRDARNRCVHHALVSEPRHLVRRPSRVLQCSVSGSCHCTVVVAFLLFLVFSRFGFNFRVGWGG